MAYEHRLDVKVVLLERGRVALFNCKACAQLERFVWLLEKGVCSQ